ncbi:polysaccharide deacetylase family protein [Vagococcus lutrae]|uniref:polysaccharide deacetylase family protein n=1 Tax=Vagococcus lutrae TaxID=81947 RepID=UPI0028920B6B|nr:polysaccharide deacetylase family protein [Vagococcus lutrae]MDT2818020.1 polysaccharide deacetylase family protein [Vagococcus lutrae]
MKKKIISLILIMTLLGAYGRFFVKNQEKKARLHYKEQEETLVNNLIEKHPNQTFVSEKMKHGEIIQFIPHTSEKEPISFYEDTMTKISGELKSTTKDDVKHVLSVEQEPLQDNVEKATFKHQLFTWNKHQEQWEEKQNEAVSSHILESRSHSPLTLGHLFQNQKNLIKVNELIQNDLLHHKKEQSVKPILSLPLLSTEETNFTYDKNHVVINFPKNELGLSQYQVNYQDVGNLLNPEYVDSAYIKPATEVDVPVLDTKSVALTFDDGPNDSTTLKILNTLKNENVPATFFMLGTQAERYPNVVKKIADEGHELANHSYNHPDLTTLPAEQVREQIINTQVAIYEASGVLPKYVRPPYGSVNYETAVAIGKPIMNWSVDSLDWKAKDKKKIIEDVKTSTHNQGIILMHDIHEQSAEALPDIITELKKQGYQFKTVSELVNQSEPLTVYYSSMDQRELSPS